MPDLVVCGTIAIPTDHRRNLLIEQLSAKIPSEHIAGTIQNAEDAVCDQLFVAGYGTDTGHEYFQYKVDQKLWRSIHRGSMTGFPTAPNGPFLDPERPSAVYKAYFNHRHPLEAAAARRKIATARQEATTAAEVASNLSREMMAMNAQHQGERFAWAEEKQRLQERIVAADDTMQHLHDDNVQLCQALHQAQLVIDQKNAELEKKEREA